MQSHDVNIDAAALTLNELINSFGFYPANSLMIRWLRSGEIVLTQRADVEAFLDHEELSESDLELFVEPGRTYLADQALVVVCLDAMEARVHAGLELVESALLQHEIDVVQVFVVVGQRIYSRDCGDDCGPHVALIDTQNDRSTRAAACESNYAEVLDAKEFPEIPDSEDLTSWRAGESQFVHDLLRQAHSSITGSELARLTVALGDIRVRDSILWDMANDVFDRHLVAEILTGVLPKLDSDRGSPVATTAGICWWLLGNGAMANLCLERSFADTPHYSLATMIRAALNYALPPDFWLESVNALTRHECLAGLDVAP
jgi:hypothetical protein